MAGLVAGLKTVLDRRIDVQEYLIWSTVIAVLMFIPIRGTFQLGYIIVICNIMMLLAFDQLTIHRNHIVAILILAGFSLIGASSTGTPLNAPASQILGISLLSIYFFCALTSFGAPLSRWMELYVRAAFVLSCFGVLKWIIGLPLHGDLRLTAIYSEPSYFVYVTLPAVGFCINTFVNERRYGREAALFLLSYILADSALGFFGLLLIAALIFVPRLKGWRLLVGAVTACGLIAGVYAASGNIRIRADEFAAAVAKQDLSGAGNTTFAFLSNIYVTSQSFLAHPFTGVGLGGYANAYDRYIGGVLGTENTADIGQDIVNSVSELNRDDAASMFLRVAAELGIPGLILLIGFLVVCGSVRGTPYTTLRNAVLPYLIVRMTRMGHYFTVELYFFVGVYLLNYLSYSGAKWPSLVFANGKPHVRERATPKLI